LKEDYAYVVDFLPYGHPLERAGPRAHEPLIHVIGEKTFCLLEVSVKPATVFDVGERICISGDNKDPRINYVRRRLRYEDLTSNARNELPYVIERMLKANPSIIIDFFNRAGPITIRKHSLELLPGIGKKHLWQIIREREREPFKSIEDIKNRAGIKDPIKLVAERILRELSGQERRRIFVRGA